MKISMSKRIYLALVAVALALITVPRMSAREDAVIYDKVVFSAGTEPKVRNEYSFKLLKIDGQPVKREIAERYRDIFPKALVPEGEHLFQLSVRRVIHAPGEEEKDVEFRAS